MRYLVKARVKPGCDSALARAIDDKTLGRGSIAGDEYLWDMEQARISADHTVTWVEVCFCPTPLAEERPYWEEYFDLLSVKDAHARKIVAIRTVKNLGPAASAIVRRNWKSAWVGKAHNFWIGLKGRDCVQSALSD